MTGLRAGERTSAERMSGSGLQIRIEPPQRDRPVQKSSGISKKGYKKASSHNLHGI